MSPSKTSSLRVAAAVLALGAALPAVAATTASAQTGSLAAAGGCGQNCIKSAIITPGVGTAKIAVETYQPATIRITVRRPSTNARPGALALSATSAAAQKSFTSTAEPLQQGADYDVTVTTKDTAGVVSSRTGKLHTLKAVPLVEPAAAEQVAPVDPGCSAECITGSKATTNLTTADLEVQTRVPATLVITAARTAPAPTSQGPMFTAPEKTIHTLLGTSWKGGMSKLKENSKYFVVVRATDEQGRTSVRQGSFKTLKRNVQVRFTDIRVTWDGDSGPGRGELTFVAAVNGQWLLHRDEDKIGSDSTVHFANGGKVDVTNVPRQLEVRVQGQERDGGKLGCFDGGGLGGFPGISAGSYAGQCGKTYSYDTAVGTFDLGTSGIVDPALPPGYGGGAMFKSRIKDQGRADVNFNVGVEVDVWAS